MIQLVVERGENTGRVWPLLEAPGVTTIGRGAGNAIALPDAKVSRLHCQIEPQGQDFILVDKSTNGVLVNDRKVQGKIALQPGIRIQVGDTVLRVEQAVSTDQALDHGRTLVETPDRDASAPVTPDLPAAAGRLRHANLVAIAVGLAAGLVIVGVVTGLALAAARSRPANASLERGLISTGVIVEPASVAPRAPVTVTMPITPSVMTPITPTIAAPAAGSVITGTVTALAGLNVHAEPRVNAAVLYQVRQREPVLIIGRSEPGDWFLIRCRADQAADAACWLANYLVEVAGLLSDMPVVSP